MGEPDDFDYSTLLPEALRALRSDADGGPGSIGTGYAIALRDHIERLTRERDQARAELVAARVAALREGFEIGTAYRPEAENEAALERRVAEIESEAGRPEKLGRFGHHPNPAIDFCVEVDAIAGLEADVDAGLVERAELLRRLERARMFRVGGDERAVRAKLTLREIETRTEGGMRR